MKKFLLICVCAFAPYNISAYSSDFPLGKLNWPANGGNRIVANNIEILWATKEFPRDSTTMSFGALGSVDIGRTVSLSSSTTAGFDFFSSLLTNGKNDAIIVLISCGGGSASGCGWYESTSFQKFVNSPYPDFHGYEITRIDLTINNLAISSPGSNPNGDGIWTDYSLDGTFTVYGVPEPTTLFLLGLGAAVRFNSAHHRLRKKARGLILNDRKEQTTMGFTRSIAAEK